LLQESDSIGASGLEAPENNQNGKLAIKQNSKKNISNSEPAKAAAG